MESQVQSKEKIKKNDEDELKGISNDLIVYVLVFLAIQKNTYRNGINLGIDNLISKLKQTNIREDIKQLNDEKLRKIFQKIQLTIQENRVVAETFIDCIWNEEDFAEQEFLDTFVVDFSGSDSQSIDNEDDCFEIRRFYEKQFIENIGNNDPFEIALTVVALYKERGFCINQQGKVGSLMHFFMSQWNEKAIEFLMSAGGDLSVEDRYGYSPAAILLECGADILKKRDDLNKLEVPKIKEFLLRNLDDIDSMDLEDIEIHLNCDHLTDTDDENLDDRDTVFQM